MLRSAKAAARWLLATTGVVVNSTVGVVPSWQFVFGRLRRAGFSPRTVFDVGVARGTPELSARFPTRTTCW